MPSAHSYSSGRGYEPSEFAEEFDEDPARFLGSGKPLALARIRGITDPDLLRAYAQVEVDRRKRSEVMGAIEKRLDEVE